MSGHRSVLNIHFVFFSMCFLHVCISKTLNANRPKRYTEHDVCHESQTTVEKVHVCPENTETLNKRSNKKNCSRYQTCAGQPLVYHCVRNGKGLVEVCAPRSRITGRFCQYYETGLGKVIEDYKKPCIMCPFQYASDRYWESSECVTTSVNNEDSSKQTSTESANIIKPKKKPCSTKNGIDFGECESLENVFTLAIEVSRSKTENGLTYIFRPDESVVSGDSKQGGEKHDDQIVTYIIVSVPVFVFCSYLVITFIHLVRKSWTTRFLTQEDGLKDNNFQKGSIKSQCNDLMYSESCEPMITKEEYASFQHI